MYEIRHYLTSSGRDLYTEWLKRQRDNTARVAIVRRVLRMIAGNFGDHKFCRDGVWELRIDVGPGYRVYYVIADGRSFYYCVAAQARGDKRTQSKDIEYACACWYDWKEREDERGRERGHEQTSKRPLA
ncbi:type II toxin-antitoxin system RelE/ParE family toxin [Janthinobacterium lividum]|nr:type II toxin-antitoxin system RelE/ParE family toxin [Janthinobacterium lividum]QKY11631.1 type II toxin-antitoxin system RelE/ParE family toxin [Janthinobacterium lividum]